MRPALHRRLITLTDPALLRFLICGVLFSLSLTARAQRDPEQRGAVAAQSRQTVDSLRKVIADSCTMEISLLTCAPGKDLYSIFGHTAIRVLDRRRGMDIVYNYGSFDDTDPLFYIHFVNGIMRYSLAAQTMPVFMDEYEYEHRPVTAQLLNLTCAQKTKLYEALRQNTLEENRYYNYHFYADNCTTRAGKMIAAQGAPVLFTSILPVPGPTLRDMIHEYVYRGGQYWSAFGIDLLLGGNLDRRPTNQEAIYFLPDYLLKGLDSAKANAGPVVAAKKTILDFPPEKEPLHWFRPVLLFDVLLVIIGLLSLRPTAAKLRFFRFFDPVFFALVGLLGLVMAYVWIFRVDDVCRNNLNLLWAIPFHLPVAFFFRRKPSWWKLYFRTTAGIAAVIGLGYAFWHQHLPIGALPLIGIIIIRSCCISKSRRNDQTSDRGKS